MSAEPRAWVLNLDAEHELEARRSYAPTLHLQRIVERESARLAGALVGRNDVIVSEAQLAAGGAQAQRARGLLGIAWSPTPRALALLERAGTRPAPAPDVSVLRTVNARPFAAAVRAALAGASFTKHIASNRDEALERLAQPAPDGWLVRRTFGAAGRGRRRIAAGKPSAAELAWLDASLRLGPLVLEPWVRVTVEYTRSGWIERDGSLVLSQPCFQSTTEHGAWTATERAGAGEVARADDDALAAAFAAAGQALAAAGYFGPFGVDAYRHRSLDGRGRSVLNPLSEINARFTMDWATAMAAEPERGEARRVLERWL